MDSVARLFARAKYGSGILHDFSEGEFPGFVGALRSIQGSDLNRHVMIPEVTLERLAVLVPEFRDVHDNMPKPSPNSYSCARFNVCSEWTNGWIVFWIKDSAHNVGHSPDLVHGQEYFRHLRTRIENLCASGRLKCSTELGYTLLRPFSFRWLSPMTQEWLGTWQMTFAPNAVDPAMFTDQTQDAETLRQYRKIVSQPRSPIEMFSAPLFRVLSPFLARARISIHEVYACTFSWLIQISIGLFAICFFLKSKIVPTALQILAFFIFGFAFIRSWALAYVSITMGSVDHRLMFAQHICLASVGIVYFGFLLDALIALCNRQSKTLEAP